MITSSLSAGYELLRQARGDRPRRTAAPASGWKRLETALWVSLAFFPTFVGLVMTVDQLLLSESDPVSFRVIALSLMALALPLWALIGGRRVERMRQATAQFQIGLSAGTTLTGVLIWRHFSIFADQLGESLQGISELDGIVLLAFIAFLLTAWQVLWILAVPAFTALDTWRGTGAVRNRGVARMAWGWCLLGVTVATTPWWAPWLFDVT
jgi:hypothetical protein